MTEIECHGLDTPELVCFYEQDFYVLSNFSAFTLFWHGLRFDALEAAYHWEKFAPRHNELRDRIRHAASAHEAFQLAQLNKHLRDPAWDDRKVVVMRERGGRTVGSVIDATDAGTIKTQIFNRVETGSTLHTDEASAYQGLDGLFYTHDTINHTSGEFVRGNVTTNGIESVFAVLKRGLIGVYHHASPKHLGRYVDEFAFRLNEGDVKRHTLARLDSFIAGAAGKRLTYEALIG